MPKIVIIMPDIREKAVLGQSLIPRGESRLGWIGIGFVIQSVLLVAAVVIPLLFPNTIRFLPRYWVTRVETPVIRPWKPQPKGPGVRAPLKPELMVEEKAEAEVMPPKPAVISPVLSTPAKKAVSGQTANAAPDVPEVTQADKNLATLGSSAIPTLRKPREQVQTGGFGDPDGVPANGKTSSAPNITQLGNYENPGGPGNGNGSSGAKGVAGATVSSGFGNGLATGGPSHGRGSIHEGMFADGAATDSTPRMRPAAATSSRNRSVQILFKPKPKYPDEARVKKIEGDVVLEVLFRSSGEVEVKRVVRGLGYGLDESAQTAAREIRFQPAL